MMRRQAPRVKRTGVAASPAPRFCAATRCVSAMATFSAAMVAGQVDDLEPVAQRGRDLVRLVGGGEEQHLGEVERELDEGVAEAVVLLGVEDLA